MKKTEIKELTSHQDTLDKNIKENWLARLGVQKPYTVFVCIMAILILGVFAFTTLKMELFPKMNLPYAIVVISPDQEKLARDYPMAGYFMAEHPSLDESYFTSSAIDTKVAQLQTQMPNINVTRDMAVIIIAVEDDTDYVTAIQNKTIEITTDTSIADVDKPTKITEAVTAITMQYMTQYAGEYAQYLGAKLGELAGTNTTAQLSTQMQSTLATVSGVKQIQSQSMTGVSIIIMEYQSGVTVDTTELILAIENANLLDDYDGKGITYTKMIMKIDPSMMPVYSFTASYTGKTKVEAEDWYENTLLPKLQSTVGVASISSRLDSQTATDQSWLGEAGNPLSETISFTIQRSTDTSTTDATKNIIATLESLRGDGFEYIEVLNQGEYISGTIGSVAQNLIIGMILAVVILFLFLRSVKMTLAISISIPLAVIATFVAMHFAGVGLNLVSMSALALAVGMLVDNSVVVLENIFRLRQKGESIRDSAMRGASQIMGAMIASTMTTICVFFPMFFLTGLIMEIFMDMVWVIIFALLCSLIVAVMFLPSIISSFKIDQKIKKEITKEPNKFQQFFINIGQWVKMTYNKALHFSIDKKWLAVGVALALFVGSASLLLVNGWILMPSTDEGEFTETISFINADASDGVDKEALANDIYNVVKGKLGDDLKTCMVEYSSGNGIMSIMSGSSGNSMSITITLADNRKIGTEGAAQEIGVALKDLIVDAEGKDYTGLLDKEVSYSSSSMTSGMVADSITVILASNKTDPVEANAELGALKDRVLAKLSPTKIDGVYSARSAWSAGTIVQIDKKVVTTFTIQVTEDAKISDVQTSVDKAVDELLKEDGFGGITTANDGFAEQLTEAFGSFGIAIGVGLILVYLVMVMVFQSFIMPLIVLICIPLAFTGAFIGLFLCGMELSVPALIGFLILMGIIVNNGILAVDYTNQARRDGLTVKEALVASMYTRMRPIFMTALTTIVGLIPMAFNWSIIGESMGGAMMQPLAVVAIGGLLFGTLTTLLVVPAFYSIFVKDKAPTPLTAPVQTGNGGSGEDATTEPEFVRVRGKKINKAKRQRI
jgi:HAE1 family hydrophobic/amphiphilic exporter-1